MANTGVQADLDYVEGSAPLTVKRLRALVAKYDLEVDKRAKKTMQTALSAHLRNLLEKEGKSGGQKGVENEGNAEEAHQTAPQRPALSRAQSCVTAPKARRRPALKRATSMTTGSRKKERGTSKLETFASDLKRGLADLEAVENVGVKQPTADEEKVLDHFRQAFHSVLHVPANGEQCVCNGKVVGNEAILKCLLSANAQVSRWAKERNGLAFGAQYYALAMEVALAVPVAALHRPAEYQTHTTTDGPDTEREEAGEEEDELNATTIAGMLSTYDKTLCTPFVKWVEDWSSKLSPATALRPMVSSQWPAFTGDYFCLAVACRGPILTVLGCQLCSYLLDHLEKLDSDTDTSIEGSWMRTCVAFLEHILRVLALCPAGTARQFVGTKVQYAYRLLLNRSMELRDQFLLAIHKRHGEEVELPPRVLDALEAIFGHSAGVAEAISTDATASEEDLVKLLRFRVDSCRAQARVNFLRTSSAEEGALEYLDTAAALVLSSSDVELVEATLPGMARAYHDYHVELAPDEPEVALLVLSRAYRALESAMEQGTAGPKVKKSMATYQHIMAKRLAQCIGRRLQEIEDSLRGGIAADDWEAVEDCVRAFVLLKYQYPMAVSCQADGSALEEEKAASPLELLPATLIDILTGIPGVSAVVSARVLLQQLLCEDEELRIRTDELMVTRMRCLTETRDGETPEHSLAERVLLVRNYDYAENEVLEYLLLCVLKSRSTHRAAALLRKAAKMRNSAAYSHRLGLSASLPADAGDVGTTWASAGASAKQEKPSVSAFEEKVKATLDEAVGILKAAAGGKGASLPVGTASAEQLLADAYFWKATVSWELYSASRALPHVCAAYEALTVATAAAAPGETMHPALAATTQRVTDLLYIFGESQKTMAAAQPLAHTLASPQPASDEEVSEEEEEEEEEEADDSRHWYALQREFFSALDARKLPLADGDLDDSSHLALLLQARVRSLAGTLELATGERPPSTAGLAADTLRLLERHQAQLSSPGVLAARPCLAWRNFGAAADALEQLGQLAELEGDDRVAEGFYKLGLLNSERMKVLSSPVRFFMRLGELHYRRGEHSRAERDFDRVLDTCAALRKAIAAHRRQYPALSHWSAEEWATAFVAPALIRKGDLCLGRGDRLGARTHYEEAAAALPETDDGLSSLESALSALSLSGDAVESCPGWLEERRRFVRATIVAKLSHCAQSPAELSASVKALQSALEQLTGKSALERQQRARLQLRRAAIVARVAPPTAAVAPFEQLVAKAFAEALALAPPKLIRQLAHEVLLFRQRQAGGVLVAREHAWEAAFLHCFSAQAGAAACMEQLGSTRAASCPRWHQALAVLDHRAAADLLARVEHFRGLVRQMPPGHTVCAVTVAPDGKSLVVTRLQADRRPLVAVRAMGEEASAVAGEFAALHEEVEENWRKYGVEARREEYGRRKLALDGRMGALVAQWQERWLGPWASLLVAQARAPLAGELEAEARRLAREAEEDWQAEETFLRALCHSDAEAAAEVGKELLRVPPARSKPPAGCRRFATEPLQLLLGGDLQGLPWEAMPVLEGRAVCRVPFVHMQAVMQALHPRPHAAAQEEAGGVEVDASKTFFLLNPKNEANLANTVRRLGAGFAAQPWRGMSCRQPTARQMEAALAEHDVYVYCGHSSSERYLDRRRVAANVGKAPVSLLMGCSSALLRTPGDFGADGFALRLLLAGSPAVVGFLWTVTDKDCDRICASLTQWLGARPEQYASSDIDVPACREDRLADMVPRARATTSLRYLNGAALVYFGVPDVRARTPWLQ